MLDPLWQAAAAGTISLISSQIVLLEVLVKPLKQRETELEKRFRQFILDSDEFSPVPVDLQILERAARIRAETNLGTADAIHAATALDEHPALFLTNDHAFRCVTGLPVVILSEVLADET